MNAVVPVTTPRGAEAIQSTIAVGGGGWGAASRTPSRPKVVHSSPHRPVRGILLEELFAAGWSASFLGAIERTAADRAVRLPSQRAVDAEVDLGNVAGNGHFRRVRLSISLPGLPREVARELVEAANAVCPFWNATRGNIEVAIDIG